MKRHGAGKRLRAGFTLIEIVVVITIVALVTGASVPMISGLTNAHMKTASLKITGNMKYLYDRAILEQLYIRMAIDLDTNSYWSESTKDPFFLTQKPHDIEDGAILIEDEEDEEEIEEQDELFDRVLFGEQDSYQWQGWQQFAEKFRRKKPSFTTYRTELSRKTELPNGISIYKVDTQSVEEPVSKGMVYIHFFPNGYIEKSVIWLAKTSELEDEDLTDRDYEIFSILPEPLTGRATIFESRVELPEDREDEEVR